MKQIYLRYSLITLLSGTLFVSCNKEQYPIPNVPVNVVLNLDLPSYIQLQNPGGYAYVNGGSRGIIVYRNFDECAVVDINPENQFELIDTCSGSIYSIVNGTVLAGPAKWGLRQYNTSWNGLWTVTIWN